MKEKDKKREIHRIGCPNLGYEDMCYKHSGTRRSITGITVHISMGCDCNCRRMKNYDREHDTTTEEPFGSANSYQSFMSANCKQCARHYTIEVDYGDNEPKSVYHCRAEKEINDRVCGETEEMRMTTFKMCQSGKCRRRKEVGNEEGQ